MFFDLDMVWCVCLSHLLLFYRLGFSPQAVDGHKVHEMDRRTHTLELLFILLYKFVDR